MINYLKAIIQKGLGKSNRLNIKNNLLFIHIPKNAGTSIISALEFPNNGHHTLKEAREVLGEKKYSRFVKIAIVRNPVERFCSLYNYARMDISFYHSSHNSGESKFGKHMDYDLLKNATINDCVQFLSEGKLVHDTAWNHWQAQSFWLEDEFGRIDIDFILRMESLATDFKGLCTKLGVQAKLQKLNYSRGNLSDSNGLNLDSLEFLKEYYKMDFSNFGYSI